jgi:hypothetical protein
MIEATVLLGEEMALTSEENFGEHLEAVVDIGRAR